MKSYKQTIREIYERAEDYEAEKRRRRTRALRIALPAFYICVCLAVVGTVIGVGVRLARQDPADVNIDPLIPGRDTEDAPDTAGGELADYDKSQNTGKPAEDKRDEESPDGPAPCTEGIPESPPVFPTGMFFRNANAVLIHWGEQIDVSSLQPVWSEMITSRDEKTVETICDEAGNVIGGVDSVSAWTTVHYYVIPVSAEEFYLDTVDRSVIPLFSSSWHGNLNSILVPDCYLDRVRPGECALVFLDKILYEAPHTYNNPDNIPYETTVVSTPGLRPDKYYGDGKFNEPNIIDVTDGRLAVTDATREAPIWTEVSYANAWADARALSVCRLEIGTKITELSAYFNAVSAEVQPPVSSDDTTPVSSGDDTTPADREPKEMPADALDLTEFWAAERQQALIAGVTLDLRYVYTRTLKLVFEHDAVQCTLPAYAGAYVFLTEPLGPLTYISNTANSADAVSGWFDCAAILAAEDSARYDAIYRLFVASLTCGFPDRIFYDDNWSDMMSRLPSPELFVSFDCDLTHWVLIKYYAAVLDGETPTRETYVVSMDGMKLARCLDNRQHEDVLPVLQDLYGEYFRGIPVDPPDDTTPPPEDSTDGPIPYTTGIPDGPNPPVPDYTDTAPLNAYLLECYGGRTGDVPPIDELWVVAFKAFHEFYFRSNVVEFCVAPELHAAFVGLLADLPSTEEGGILFFYAPDIDDVIVKYDPARGIASVALVPMVDQGCKREFEAVVYTAVLSHLLENYGDYCTISAGSKLLFSRTHPAASADEWAKIILSGEYVRADFEAFSFIEGQSSADLYAAVCASYVDELF